MIHNQFFKINFWTAPVPGGCNQVFELETDANIKLSSLPHQTKVWFQLANVGYHRNDRPPSCDSNSNLQYVLYVAYVKEGDHGFEAMFDTLQQMLTPEMIESNAYKVYVILLFVVILLDNVL